MHGQLYVAASRVGHPDRIRFALLPDKETGKFLTRNVVYHDALDHDAGVSDAPPGVSRQPTPGDDFDDCGSCSGYPSDMDDDLPE